MMGWMKTPVRLTALLLGLALAGCATTVPYTGIGPYPQIERGAPLPPVDAVGNFLSLPIKLLLWNWKLNVHSISPDTEEKLVAYLQARHLPALADARFQLNEYHPGQDLSRLVHNHYVAWPYRLLIGFPVTLIVDVLLPGRLFPWGDYYNPYTNTVHLYSDLPAVALHEAGHAHDLATRRFKGTYSAARLIPFVDLYQEYKATQEAIRYLKEIKDHETEFAAYKVLYPAYGTYVGGYFFPPFGTLGGVLLGHAAGRSEVALQRHHYGQAAQTPPPAPSEPPASPPASSAAPEQPAAASTLP